jgi:hypothetical protein
MTISRSHQKTRKKSPARSANAGADAGVIPVFRPENYNSGDGMITSIWGPPAWHFIHTVSFNYPVRPTCEDRKNYRNFVTNLENILPCGKCRKNLRKNFRKLPLENKDLESRATFSLYIYKLHELINTMLNKKSGLSYEAVRERYEHFRSRCTRSLKLLKRKPRIQKPKVSAGEKGCTEPLYGNKAKCVLHIVPKDKKCETFEIDNTCLKRHAAA